MYQLIIIHDYQFHYPLFTTITYHSIYNHIVYFQTRIDYLIFYQYITLSIHIYPF